MQVTRMLPAGYGKWSACTASWRAGDMGEDAPASLMILIGALTDAHDARASLFRMMVAGSWSKSGGFSTKVHRDVDNLGNPLRFTLTGGQAYYITSSL